MATRAIIAFVIIAAAANAVVRPAAAGDDCPEEGVYCDHELAFKVPLPLGFKQREERPSRVSAHFIFDGPPRRSCPVISETSQYTDYTTGVGTPAAFWKEVFRLAGFDFEPADLHVLNGPDERERTRQPNDHVGDRSAYNDHQVSLVHLRFKYKGQSLQAWQALYWRKSEQQTDPAKPIPSRIYFLNCTELAGGEAVPTVSPVSDLFKGVTPLVCKKDRDGKIVGKSCKDATPYKAPLPAEGSGVHADREGADREGNVEVLSDKQAELAASAAVAAAAGAQ